MVSRAATHAVTLKPATLEKLDKLLYWSLLIAFSMWPSTFPANSLLGCKNSLPGAKNSLPEFPAIPQKS
jgi:hypothetical protein